MAQQRRAAVCAALVGLGAWGAPGHAQARETGRTASAPWVGQVTRVVDGDSLWVRPHGGGAPRRLRLQGIDAPELCQQGGTQAHAALQGLLRRQWVRVQVRAVDEYGRLLVQVLRRADGQDVAAWMAHEGWALSPGFRGQPGPYAEEEQAARQARRGLFALQSEPESPRDFRRRHGPCR